MWQTYLFPRVLKHSSACPYDIMEFRVSVTDITERQALFNIWKVCFSDEDGYINAFIDNRAENAVIIGAYADDLLIGATYLLSAQCVTDNGSMNALYLYALGVLPSYRGNKIGEKIIEAAKEEAEKRGAILFLCPANEKLSSYYKGLGFSGAFCLKKYKTELSDVDEIEIASISASEYADIRNNALSYPGCIIWDEKAISFSAAEYGSCLYKAIAGGNEYPVFVSLANGGVLKIKECLAPDEYIPSIMNSLMRMFKCNRAETNLPNSSLFGDEFEIALLFGNEQFSAKGYANLLME